jgi:hypothetical protein
MSSLAANGAGGTDISRFITAKSIVKSGKNTVRAISCRAGGMVTTAPNKPGVRGTASGIGTKSQKEENYNAE